MWSCITLDQLCPFVHRFYAHPFPLYFSKTLNHGDLTVISFKFDTRHGDPMGGVLLALTHFHVFCPIIVGHPTCVFPSLTNDTCIVCIASNVAPIVL